MTEGVPILFSGEGYVVVDKPWGVPVIPGRGEVQTEPLVERVQAQLHTRLWVVHRLDRDTSGLLIFATDARAHRTLSMAFESGQVAKTYVAIVHGHPTTTEVDLPLAPARRGRMRVARPSEPSKAARTQLRPLELLRGASLVEAVPLTGRTHQIRVHLSAVGHPLLVDHQYGRREPVTDPALLALEAAKVLVRTPLHAVELSLPALEGIEPRLHRSPLPPDMEQARQLLTER